MLTPFRVFWPLDEGGAEEDEEVDEVAAAGALSSSGGVAPPPAPAPAAGVVVVAPDPECSEAPKSLPQLVLYHVLTCCRSVGLVQVESQMPVAEERKFVR